MHRNRVKPMAGLLVRRGVLVLVLVNCGGDEAVGLAAPPPALPPVQSQPPEIGSGSPRRSTTLITIEAGGFTPNGELASSCSASAESNDNDALTLPDGTWNARLALESMGVTLGSSGQSIALAQFRNNGYGVDDTAIESGHTGTASNGSYTPTMADGVWMVGFDPGMRDVLLGSSGDSVTTVQLELDGYSLKGKPITANTAYVTSEGATYGIGLGPDGPVVVYIPATTTAMLGMYGGEITLTLAEDQMPYLRHGEVFMSGTVVSSNDRDYIVSLVDGEWIADFIKPMPTVDLGSSGRTVTLIQHEARDWWLYPKTPIASGDTYMVGVNDHTMTLSDGIWTAKFAPKRMDVTPGASGDSITATQVEAGGYINDDTLLSDGAHAKATNGATYSVAMDEDGIPVATYVPRPVTVHLGDLGGTITLFLQEDQMTWILEGETEPFTSGRVISIESIGNTYTVTLGEDGVWTGVHNEVEVMVDLGASGDVLTFIRDERGGWRTDSETPFQTGGTYTADNGNEYRLILEGGEWTATYVPATMMIAGTGLTAVRNEDQTAEPRYHIMGDADQKLDENAMGSVMSPDGNFRVHMDADGNLIGVLYELAVNGENDGKGGYSIGGVSVIGDDAKTVPNEAGTMITIDGVKHLTADLFNHG